MMPSEDSEHQPGSNGLQGGDRVFQKTVHILNLCLMYGGCSFSHSQDSPVLESRPENKSGSKSSPQ